MNTTHPPLDLVMAALDRALSEPSSHPKVTVQALAGAVERIALEAGHPVTPDQALRAATAQLAPPHVEPAVATVTSTPSIEKSSPAPGVSWRARLARWFTPIPDTLSPSDYAKAEKGSLDVFPMAVIAEAPTARDIIVERLGDMIDLAGVVSILSAMFSFAAFSARLMSGFSLMSAWLIIPLTIFSMGIFSLILLNVIKSKRCPEATIYNNARMISRHRYAMKLHAFDEPLLVRAMDSEEVEYWCSRHIRAHLNAHFSGWSMRKEDKSAAVQ